METLIKIYAIIGTVFSLLYLYQAIFIIVPFIKKHKPHKETVIHTIGVLISARNESAVISQLIDSINAQDYPKEALTVFVVADNCTDNTAEISREHGAVVYERFNKEKVGKGYALNYLLQNIENDYKDNPFDAYIVLDADNVLEPNYVTEMNKTFSDGYQIVTGYRNSKNYGDSWVSAGYALWFLRESKYLNNSRMLTNTSCAIGGTGFLFSREICNKYNGWNFFLLTEDIEFTVQNVIDGQKIGFCPNAVLYDEQPTSFKQSWKQRLRWSKGFLQVFSKYGTKLAKSIFTRNFTSCMDMMLVIFPSIITILSFFALIITAIVAIALQMDLVPLITWLLCGALMSYPLMFVIGLVTTITEWKQIHCETYKKILYMFTFPIFIATNVPITIEAFFKKVEWTPIPHTKSRTISEIRRENSNELDTQSF